jgi:hypothetical protein
LFFAYKVVIQLLVASFVGRKLEYFSFNDEKFTESVNIILKLISDNKIRVAQLYQLLTEYCRILTEQKADVDDVLNQFDQFLNEKFNVPMVSF